MKRGRQQTLTASWLAAWESLVGVALCLCAPIVANLTRGCKIPQFLRAIPQFLHHKSQSTCAILHRPP